MFKTFSGLARQTLVAAIAVVSFALPATADSMSTPTGAVLLTVTGPLATMNAGDAAAFDLQMLQDMAAHEIETTTIWTDGVQTFTGVRLQTLMEALGVTSGNLRATAINDYAIDIPFSDAANGSALIAYARNGRTMSVRDKGPLWIVYPYDTDTRYQSEVYYSRSIWQLDRLDFVEGD